MAKNGFRRGPAQPKKMQRLPNDARITKRPLIRPAIPSPHAGASSPKVIYISSKTPFMSAFQRLKGLFKHIETRSTQSELARQRNASRRRGRGGLSTGSGKQNLAGENTEENPEPVIIKATGKAIDKALQLALFLQQQPEYDVRISTGSTVAIDDIEMVDTKGRDVVGDGSAEPHSKKKHDDNTTDVAFSVTNNVTEKAKESEAENVMADQEDEEDELPESRIRFTSIVEITVTLH